MKIIAIVAAHNEDDVISHVIGDLVRQGIEVYLLDHRSTDGTVAQASMWLGKGLLKIETFPDDAGYPEENRDKYIWTDILRRKEELAATLDADWYIHHDADEFRESPFPFMTLKQAISLVDKLGYNAIDFNLLNFRPINNDYLSGQDVRRSLKFFEFGEKFDACQVKAWKNLKIPVDLAATAGHDIQFKGRNVFPIKFLLRHYPIRSQEHGLKKVILDRKSRFSEEESLKGWHIQYDHIKDHKHNFLHDKKTLYLYIPIATKLYLMGKQALLKFRKTVCRG
jgi:hypothetical protein